LVHAVHGLRHAYGMVMPKGVAKCRHAVVEQLESEQAKLPPLRQEMFGKWVEECVALETPRAYDPELLEALATTPPACQRLRTIPGIGP
jgi:transposase